MAKKKISKSELKQKEMINAWKIAHSKPKKILLRRNAIDEYSIKISQKQKAIIKTINKLADNYPPTASNSNQNIWRPWE